MTLTTPTPLIRSTPLLTVCCVVKNESEIIRSSLESISQVADEIIVIDNNSTDNTFVIAQEFTQHVYLESNPYHAANIRNLCDSYASGSYIMRWDADWLLDESSINRLKELKRHSFFGKDLVFFMWNSELDSNNTVIKSQPQYFVYKKDVFTWKYPIHNKLTPRTHAYEPTLLRDYKVFVQHIKQSPMHNDRAFQSYSSLQQALKEFTSDADKIYLYPFLIMISLYLEMYNEAEEILTRLDMFWNELEYETKILSIESKIALFIGTNRIPLAQESLSKAMRDPIISNDPRLDILHGDVAVFVNTDIALHYYQTALNKFNQLQQIQNFNSARYLYHPEHMIQKLTEL